jgi:hypothetical protein
MRTSGLIHTLLFRYGSASQAFSPSGKWWLPGQMSESAILWDIVVTAVKLSARGHAPTTGAS